MSSKFYLSILLAFVLLLQPVLSVSCSCSDYNAGGGCGRGCSFNWGGCGSQVTSGQFLIEMCPKYNQPACKDLSATGCNDDCQGERQYLTSTCSPGQVCSTKCSYCGNTIWYKAPYQPPPSTAPPSSPPPPTIPSTCDPITVTVIPNSVTSGDTVTFQAQSSYGYTCVSMNSGGGAYVNSNSPDSISCSGGVCTWSWIGRTLNPNFYTATFTGEKGGATCIGISGSIMCSGSGGYRVNPKATSTTVPPTTTTIKNMPPVADAGPDQTVFENEFVVLDGIKSYDPDGYIVSYEWREEEILLSNSISFSRVYSVGSHAISLKVTDNKGAADLDAVTVVVKSKPVKFVVDVYDTEVQPSSVKQDGEMVILSNVRLSEAPDGKHPVSVSMSIDDREFDSETLNLAKTESQSISFNLKANNFTEGIHNVTVEASVEESSDKETKELEIEETPQFVLIDDVGVSPISICNDENEELFLFARIKSQLPDPSKIKAMFFVKDNSGKFILIGDDEEILDENEDDMLSVRYGIKPFQLDPGMNEAKIIVQGEGRDTEFTKFVVKDCGGKSIEDLLSSKPDHCLVAEDIWVEDKTTPQKNVDVRAKISNCGKNTERNIIASLQAFRKSYYSPIFSLGVNQTKDILFTVYTPTDLSRIFRMSAFATNKYVSDSLTR